MSIDLTWHGGPNNQVLGKNTTSHRFNELIEVPDGSYADDMKIIPAQIIFSTKRKHKMGTVRAFINNVEYPTTEARTIGYNKGYHFFIPGASPVGYLYVKYYPSLEIDWLSNTPIVNDYIICDNRPAVIHKSTLNEIKIAIDQLDSYIASNYSTTVEPINKRVYYEDHLVLLNDYTHIQIKTYQQTVNDIKDSLVSANPDFKINYTLTPITSNLMLSVYISELRYAINAIRDILNA